MGKKNTAQANKGNGASTRMSNANYKALRARCWLSGHARKLARIEAQREREEMNKVRRSNGEPTPWEFAKARRAVSRKFGVDV